MAAAAVVAAAHILFVFFSLYLLKLLPATDVSVKLLALRGMTASTQ